MIFFLRLVVPLLGFYQFVLSFLADSKTLCEILGGSLMAASRMKGFFRDSSGSFEASSSTG